MRPGVVFIGEDEETVDGDRFLMGRFSGYLDKGNRRWDAFHDLSLDEAVAWARERADRIVVHFAYEDPIEWPAEGLAAPTRRRAPEEAWKDRTDADPDARWTVTLWLAPPEPGAEGDDAVAAEAAQRLGAMCSAESLKRFLALGRGDGGWATYDRPAYELRLPLRAPTAERAREAAASRLPPLPERWSISYELAFEGE